MLYRVFVVVCLLSATALSAPEKKPAVVFAKPVVATELFETLTYPARIDARISATVLAETDGVITTIHSPIGQKVLSRQKLMTIGHTDPTYQYAPLRVLAPVKGVVSSVEVTEGSQVVRGQKLATVTDPSRITLKVEVPASDLALLGAQPGSKGVFHSLNSEKSIAVHVRGLSPFVDASTGTASCEIEFDDAKSAALVLPGMLGQVAFKVNQHRGFSIPEYAIHYKGNDPYIRLVEKGKAKNVGVTLGHRERGTVEILKGLTDHAVLVERNSRYIADGEDVVLEDEAK